MKTRFYFFRIDNYLKKHNGKYEYRALEKFFPIYLGNNKDSYTCLGNSYSNSLFFISAVFSKRSIDGTKFS